MFKTLNITKLAVGQLYYIDHSLSLEECSNSGELYAPGKHIVVKANNPFLHIKEDGTRGFFLYKDKFFRVSIYWAEYHLKKYGKTN